MAASGFIQQMSFGVQDGNPRPAGYVGEYMEQVVASANSVTLASGSIINLATLTLTPGDWTVTGNITIMPSIGVTVLSSVQGGLSTTSLTLPDPSLVIGNSYTALQTASVNLGFAVPSLHSLSANTVTVFLVVQSSFSIGSNKVCGRIAARRLS